MATLKADEAYVRTQYPQDPLCSRYAQLVVVLEDGDVVLADLTPQTARRLAPDLIESAFCAEHGISPSMFPDRQIPTRA